MPSSTKNQSSVMCMIVLMFSLISNGVCLVSSVQFVDVYSHVFLSIASLDPRGR